jgi:hypothetical protein
VTLRLPDPAGSRAVVIGVSKYRYLESLPAVANNVETLHELLTSAGGWRLPPANCVKILNPPSASAVLQKVHAAAREARSALLVYFAGHGLLDDGGGELHLALSNSALDRMHDALAFAAIRREVVQTAAGCSAKVVLIDSCHSGLAMTGFMGGGTSVADLAVTDGAYIMTASGEQAVAMAPGGARYTAFTGALVKAVRRGVPGGPAMLDMDTVYDQVMLDLRAQNLPTPQRRSRNDGNRIVLAPNSAAKQSPAKKKKAAPPAKPAPQPAAPPAAKRKPAAPQPAAQTPRRRASVRAGRRDIDRSRRLIRAALGEQPLLPIEAAAALLIKEVPTIFEASWAGAGTCKLFLAKYLPDFPYTQNRTGGFIEAPPPFPRNVLGMLRRRLTVKRVRGLTMATALVVSLFYGGREVVELVDQQRLVDPDLRVTSPDEGSLTKSRYTVKVSKAPPDGDQVIAMVREEPGRWSFYRCTTVGEGSECATVPIGKKDSGKRMQLALIVVSASRGRALLGSSPPDFRDTPAALAPVAASRIYEYQR